MGILDRLRGGKQNSAAHDGEPQPEPGLRQGVPIGMNTDQPILNVTDTAQEKIAAVLASQNPPVRTIRVSAPFRGKYAMNLEPEENPQVDDTLVPFNGFQIFIDSQSLPLVEGATLDYIETYGGGGFQFTNPNDQAPKAKQAPEGPEGDFWRELQAVLDNEVNPAVASHGGHIEIMDVQDKTVYVKMGGGCQGCGQAAATLRGGVERILRDHFPQIEEILDVTDHAGGRNPYYAPAGH